MLYRLAAAVHVLAGLRRCLNGKPEDKINGLFGAALLSLLRLAQNRKRKTKSLCSIEDFFFIILGMIFLVALQLSLERQQQGLNFSQGSFFFVVVVATFKKIESPGARQLCKGSFVY